MSEISKEKQIDILLQTIERHWNQAIQNEKQRANFTNYILLIVGAVQGYIIQRNFDKLSVTLALIISIFSFFGVLITKKYYERFSLHASRVGKLMEKIKQIEPEIDLDSIENKADEKHNKRFPIMRGIRLNSLWLYFYYFLACLGIIDVLIIYL